MFKKIKSRMLFRAFLIVIFLISLSYLFNITNHKVLSLIALVLTPMVLFVTSFITKPINKIQKIIDSNLNDLSLNHDDLSNLSELEKLEKSFISLIDLNKKHVKDILENERRISSMIDSIDVGIVEIDGNNRIVINVNQYCSELLGIPKEDIIGKMYCYNLICCHDKNIPCSLGNSDDYSKVHKECTTYNRITGKKIQVLKNAVKIPVSNSSNIVESFINITDRKRREEELAIAKAKADEADAGKTNLLKKVCHDIGNRMSESVGLAGIMLKIPSLPPEIHSRLNQIIDSLRVMDNSLQLMRDRTMIMTGQSKIHLTSVDLKEFIKVHVNSFISGIEEKGLKFILDISEECQLRKNCYVLTD
jgi:PAS domain S-box-containing protein